MIPKKLLGLYILIGPGLSNRKTLLTVTGAGLICSALFGLTVILKGNVDLLLFSFGKNLNLYFHVDEAGRLFAGVVTLVWVLAVIGAIAAVAGIAYAVYRYMNPDSYDDFDFDDFDDDFEDEIDVEEEEILTADVPVEETAE